MTHYAAIEMICKDNSLQYTLIFLCQQYMFNYRYTVENIRSPQHLLKYSKSNKLLVFYGQTNESNCWLSQWKTFDNLITTYIYYKHNVKITINNQNYPLPPKLQNVCSFLGHSSRIGPLNWKMSDIEKKVTRNHE